MKMKMNTNEKEWILNNMKEVVSELRNKSELIKNFSKELEEFRIREDRVGYNTKFNELLKKEEEKINGRKNK
jgi:hypothetical protein